MKKIIFTLVFMSLFFLTPSTEVKAASSTIDTSNSDKGYVTVTASADIVVQVTNGSKKYIYTLTNSEPTNLPLQLGTGTYSIMTLKKVSDGKYTAVQTKSVEVKSLGNEVYLNSIQLIDFDEDMVSISDMTDIVDDGATDSEKTEILYEYVLEKFAYDFDKAKTIATKTNYLPVIDDTYSSKKGICYDMSSMLAGVLRQNDIPTKLVMGYTPNVSTYHSWNEVYYDNKWHVIDVTYDLGLVKASKKSSMLKSESDYSITKLY